jgi:fluoride ion exporter CrcB/FEX
MELHERLVSAVLGALWGALLGLLLALFFHYVVGSDFDKGFLIVNWKNTIVGSAVVFAILGLVFKATAGTIVGTLMSWVWSVIEHDRKVHEFSIWSVLLVLAALAYWLYTIKG